MTEKKIKFTVNPLLSPSPSKNPSLSAKEVIKPPLVF